MNLREIKFRGKSLSDNEWKYGDIEHRQRITDDYLKPSIAIGGYYISKDTIGQYLGLKDVDGKEIYEGDIVDWIFFKYDRGWEDERHVIGVIEWYQGGFILMVRKDTDFEDAGFYGISNLNTETESDVKVLGNIYDNKELLKSKRIDE